MMHADGPFLRKLEFDKIVDRIVQHAISEPGKHRARSLRPFPLASGARLELARVEEAKRLLIAEGGVPIEGLKDITIPLRKCVIENSVLTAPELLDVGSTLRVSRLVHALLARRKDLCVLLAETIHKLVIDKVVEYNITQAVDESGGVRDGASKELRTIRDDMVTVGQQLRKRLEGILRRVSDQAYVQDEIITTRDGRLVIPVKTEFRKQIPGFIHSSSASGATTYIEPAETLELNNALRELQLREQQEIQRILKELTGQVRGIRESLEQTQAELAYLDVLFAKGRYSIEVIGAAAELTDGGVIRLREARHPVLLQRHSRDKVVPLSLDLGGEMTGLVITGPNAGGKSVTLKTVGLLCLCTQAGIHIPASPDSSIPAFEQIFVEIGDDQSIEQDLSTFSSHLVHLNDILTNATAQSLVLIDELGAGTDPEEGGAVGMAVLDELLRRKTTTIVTTHLGSLKAFAHDRSGMVNGSMEFDQRCLAPTFRFLLGVPGSSYALELAHRIGLPQSLLEFAKDRLGPEKVRLESLLAELSQKTQEYETALRRLTEEKDLLAGLVGEYETKLAGARDEMRDLKRKAAADAQEIITRAQSTVERVIREIREHQASSETLRGARQSMQEVRSQILKEAPTEDEPKSAGTISPGDAVRLREGSATGEVRFVDGDTATVIWSHGTLKVPLRELVRAGRPAFEVMAPASALYEAHADRELDVRGLSGDEAVAKVQEFLENAVAAGLHRVDIIHGKGTGILRKRVNQALKGFRLVKSYRLGEWNEGGAGVTVVELGETT